MAFPKILVNSSGGADTNSGAGPSTAITGTSGSSNGAGTLLTLDGSPDLSGVAVDGSHAINFGGVWAKITAKDDGADTVTVSDSVGSSLSGQNWAIGGVLASHGSTASRLLFERSGGVGDAKAGWVIEMESGHTETITSLFSWRSNGDTTDGRIFLQGAFGAATTPIVTFTINDDCYRVRGTICTMQDFEMRNSNGSHTQSVATRLEQVSGILFHFIRMIVSHSTQTFNIVVQGNNSNQCIVMDCDLGFCTSSAISIGFGGGSIINNFIHDCGSHGVNWSTTFNGNPFIQCNVFYNNGGDGLLISTSDGNADAGAFKIQFNVFHDNTGDGVNFSGAVNAHLRGAIFSNNILSDNGGFGLNFSGTSITTAALEAHGFLMLNSNTFNNTSGACNLSGDSILVDDPGLDPQFGNAATGDFSIGTNLKEKGFPLTQAAGITSTSFVDIGAMQREEPAGGAGGLQRSPGMNGNING